MSTTSKPHRCVEKHEWLAGAALQQAPPAGSGAFLVEAPAMSEASDIFLGQPDG
jgi:hypothetical protein